MLSTHAAPLPTARSLHSTKTLASGARSRASRRVLLCQGSIGRGEGSSGRAIVDRAIKVCDLAGDDGSTCPQALSQPVECLLTYGLPLVVPNGA
jgi:hypothetical protein